MDVKQLRDIIMPLKWIIFAKKSADSARLLLDSKCMLTGNGLRLCVMTTLKCDGCRERLRELIDALDHYE